MAWCPHAADCASSVGLGRLAHDRVTREELSSMHVDAELDEGRYLFVRHAFVSNQNDYVVKRADQSSADRSDFPMIGDDDLLPRLAHHGAMNRGLVGIVCS